MLLTAGVRKLLMSTERAVRPSGVQPMHRGCPWQAPQGISAVKNGAVAVTDQRF